MPPTIKVATQIYTQTLAAANGSALHAAANLTKSMLDYPDTRTDDALEALTALLREALLSKKG